MVFWGTPITQHFEKLLYADPRCALFFTALNRISCKRNPLLLIPHFLGWPEITLTESNKVGVAQ